MSQALKTNSALLTLKYAAPRLKSDCQQPLTHHFDSFVCSLSLNGLEADAAKNLSEGLKANSTLQTLEYAANHPSCPHITDTQVSSAADRML